MQNLVFKWNGTSNKKLMRKIDQRKDTIDIDYKFFFFCFFTNSHSTGA